MVDTYNASYDYSTTVFSMHSMKALIPSSLQPFLLLSYPTFTPAPSNHHLSRHAFFSNSNTPPTSITASSSSAPRHSSSYRTSPTSYDKGPQDIYFVVFCAIAFTLLREGLIRFALRPFADNWLRSANAASRAKRKGGGAGGGSPRSSARVYKESRAERKKREHASLRFAEQGWSFLYCTVFWSLGMAILLRIPSPLSPHQLWGSYPVVLLPGLTKFYYLAQLGWWLHQIFVINTEKRRQDHWQMFCHHILTIGLVVGSYWCNFTRVGVVVHVLMDFCDIILPLAKMFRYLSLSTLCDLTFILFLLSWIFSREVGLIFVLRTIYIDAPNYMTGKFDPSRDYYYCTKTWWIFVALLGFLLVLTTAWFYMAMRVAVRVVRGLGAEDSRSDDEDEGEEAEAEVEVEVEVEDGFENGAAKVVGEKLGRSNEFKYEKLATINNAEHTLPSLRAGGTDGTTEEDEEELLEKVPDAHAHGAPQKEGSGEEDSARSSGEFSNEGSSTSARESGSRSHSKLKRRV